MLTDRDTDWTPAKGWRKVAVRLAIAGAATFLCSLLAAWLMMLIAEGLVAAVEARTFRIPWFLWMPLSGALGAACGWIASRKLVENTGIFGGVLAVAVAAVLVLGQVAACWVSVSLWGAPRLLTMFHGVAGIGSCSLAIYIVLTDS
jgi:hypothetical protein